MAGLDKARAKHRSVWSMFWLGVPTDADPTLRTELRAGYGASMIVLVHDALRYARRSTKTYP